ncbi:MAG: Sensor protein, partial [Myxococcaceae bacterium]|nr:Sensor protein [Myxococcaceae bacterium]
RAGALRAGATDVRFGAELASHCQTGVELDVVVRELGVLRSCLLELAESAEPPVCANDRRALDDFMFATVVEAAREHGLRHGRGEHAPGLREPDDALARERAARIKAEAEQKRLHELFMQAPAAICITEGVEHIYVFANAAYLEVVGRRESELLGKAFFAALPEMAGQRYDEKLDRVFKTGRSEYEQARPVALMQNGQLRTRWFNVAITAKRDPGGDIDGVIRCVFDVTEQVLAQQRADSLLAQLRESEERQRRVVDASGVGLWELDVASESIAADPRLLTLMGVPSASRLTLSGALDAVHEDDRELLGAAIAAAVAGENAGYYVAEYRTVGDGSLPLRWLESRAQVLFDERGHATRVAGASIDITARRQAEAEREVLLASEAAARVQAQLERAKLHGLFMQAPVAVAILEGPKHVFTFANPAYRALVHGREVEGKPLLEALPDIDGLGFDTLLEQVMSSGETYFGRETAVRLAHHRGDEQLIVNFIYTPKQDVSGRVDGVLVTGWDVTELVQSRTRTEALAEELRASEGQLRLVTDAIPLLVSFVTADERYLLLNKAYEDWFGQPGEDLVGKSVQEVIGPAAYQVLAPQVRRVLAGEKFSLEQYAVPYRSAGTRDIRISFIPHHDRSGAVDGYVSLVEDITARRIMEQERERAVVALRRQSEFEQQLIGIVSHDLRNPLNVILLSSARLARSEELSANASKNSVRIQNAAERATRMVADLLDFTQARLGGGIRIEPRPTDLHLIVGTVLDEVEAAHPGRLLELSSEGDGRGEWDHDRLLQVVQNLVTNAVKYSPPDSTIQIVTQADEQLVTLAVCNEGPPIPAEKLPILFEPFQRAVAQVDKVSRSVGLGLYIVRQVVEAHQGTVEVASTLERGTTFTVRLPRRASVPKS